jgi:hypothetical protein
LSARARAPIASQCSSSTLKGEGVRVAMRVSVARRGAPPANGSARHWMGSRARAGFATGAQAAPGRATMTVPAHYDLTITSSGEHMRRASVIIACFLLGTVLLSALRDEQAKSAEQPPHQLPCRIAIDGRDA